jgi:nucleotide-binding universal stress UspA family protein
MTMTATPAKRDTSDRPVLLCYDGSRQADRAITEAGALIGGGPAVVAHVWEPLSEALRRSPDIPWPGRLVEDEWKIDAAALKQAREVVHLGVQLARAAGFDPDPVISKADHGVADALTDVARQHQVRAIVLGSHGRSTGRTLKLGSVARALLEHCDRSTLVVGFARESAERYNRSVDTTVSLR